MSDHVVETKYDELKRQLTEAKTKQECLRVALLLGQAFYHHKITEVQHEALLELCGSLYHGT